MTKSKSKSTSKSTRSTAPKGKAKARPARTPSVSPRRAPGAAHAPLRALAAAPAQAAVAASTREAHIEAALHGSAASRWHLPHLPSVPVLLHDARELLEVAKRSGRKLVAAGLDEKLLRELPRRIDVLADAQKAWDRQRARTTPAALRGVRADAAQLKTDLLAAGRYVLRHDAAAQRELDAIARGDGLEDLINDLHALAGFFQSRAAVLREAGLSADAPLRAREFAEQLASAARVAAREEASHPVHAERNRAVALLGEAVTEVRAAGRFVFRSVPSKLALFRHEYRFAHAARLENDATSTR